MSTRVDAVAGQFYPADPDEIERMFTHYNEVLESHISDEALFKMAPRAIIVPHAGYVYSGFTANIAMRLLSNSAVKRIVVIGPSHRVYLTGTSVADFDTYETPMGSLPIDKGLVNTLKSEFGLSFEPTAHAEHSTEVQMPFIRRYLKAVSIVELVYGAEEPRKLAKIIEYLLEDPQTAVVISTDLSHYHDITKANRLDSICLDAVEKLNTDELHQGCEACGKIGVEAMLLASEAIGLRPVLLDYRTSADASGDKSQVVGYMSAAFID